MLSPARGTRACVFAVALSLFASSIAHAQGVPTLVRDIATQSGPVSHLKGSTPPEALTIGAWIYFAAESAELGIELWRTDGTAAGTQLVRDINLGIASSAPQQFAALGGVLYFSATGSLSEGRELWRSDGTASGTYRVREIFLGLDGSDPRHLIAIGSYVYFSAEHDSYGRELWRTDGTALGTTLVVDAKPGLGHGVSPDAVIVPGIRSAFGTNFSAAYWACDDGVHGEELWETSAFNTGISHDIRPGFSGSNPRDLTSLNGHILFSADDGSSGREPYHNFGGGTTRIGDLNPGIASSGPANFAAGSFSGVVKFYFSAFRAAQGNELWLYDTGSGGTTLIADVNPGTASSDPVPYVAATTVLFSAETSPEGRELWKTNGTTAGTVLVRDLHGRGSSSPEGFFQISSVPLRVLFRATGSGSDTELWVTDGTNAGTQRVLDLRAGSAGSVPDILALMSNQRALLSATPDGVLTTFYRSNGTALGTDLLAPAPAGSASSFPLPMSNSYPSASLLLAADDGLVGSELWRSDGSNAGTQLLRDLVSGPTSALATGSAGTLFAGLQAVALDDLVIFYADDGVHGQELWVTDGTAGGTQLLADIRPGTEGSVLSALFVMDGFVLFFADDGTHGRELWRTDGTPAGTALVKDLVPGSGAAVSVLSNVIGRRAGLLYFAATDPVFGLEPHISDGTTAGTVLLRDVRPGSGSSLPFIVTAGHPAAVSPTAIYFVADDGVHGQEIWRSEGTTSTTQLFADLDPGSTGSDLSEMVFTDRLYVSGGVAGVYGLRTVNSAGAATLLGSFPLGTFGDGGVSRLTPLGSRVLFAAFRATDGWEPWITDGTPSGTQLLRQIGADDRSGLPTRLGLFAELFGGWFYVAPGADVALFCASSVPDGLELWRTDGTTAGTVLHAEIAPGPTSSNPTQPVLAGDTLYLSAYEPATGRELYALTPPALTSFYLRGCSGTNSIVPCFREVGAPHLGNPSYALVVEQARPSSVVALHVGFGAWNVPLGGGCSLAVDLLLPYAPFSTVSTRRGEATFSLALPSDPLLDGLEFFAQAYVVDPHGAFAGLLAFTGGARAIVR
jgi:ELWxxDGT repeat protein